MGRVGTYVFTLTPVSSTGQALVLSLRERGKVRRFGEAGEEFEVLEVSADVFEGVAVFLGGFRLGVVVVVMMVVPRGVAAAGGTVFFGQVRPEEHCEEGRRGFGLSDLLEEDDLDLFGVFEDGYCEALVEAEGVFGLPRAGVAEGDSGCARGVGECAGASVLIEVEGLAIPGVGVFRGEFVEADAEVTFELGGFVGGDA